MRARLNGMFVQLPAKRSFCGGTVSSGRGFESLGILAYRLERASEPNGSRAT